MSSAPKGPSLEGIRVLVVDDLELDAKLCRILLEQAGCQVRVAANVREAVALVVSFQPLIMLVDIRLPDASGLALARRLKGGLDTHGIVIVAITAYSGEEAARAAGCDGFITKPIDVEQFAETLRSIFNGGNK